MLPPEDLDYLKATFPKHSVTAEGNMICIVIPDFVLPTGLSVGFADLLFRLSAGYPDVPPDMWWFSPLISNPSGLVIAQTQSIEIYLGRSWQRWSRHLPPGQWQSGIDSIESYLTLVRRELNTAAGRAAA